MSNSDGFYCSVCNIHFADSLAAESHKASMKHKKRSGEHAAELQQYKRDEDVTVEDVLELLERQRVALEVQPWSELRYKPQSPSKESHP